MIGPGIRETRTAPSLLFIAIRELAVLLFGTLVMVVVAYLFLGAGRPRPPMMPFANPLAAVFLPMIVCFLRAGLVRQASPDASKIRSVLYQISIAIALIFLLLFESGIGLFVGAPGIPLVAWLVVAGFGVLYVVFFCLAEAISPVCDPETMGSPFAPDPKWNLTHSDWSRDRR